MAQVSMETLKKSLEEILEPKLKLLSEQIVQNISAEIRRVEARVEELETWQTKSDNYSRINNVIFHGVPQIPNEDPLVVTEKLGEVPGCVNESGGNRYCA